MARNAPDPSKPRQSSRVTKSPVQRTAAPARGQAPRDRKRFWVQLVAGFLVLMMLLPVVAFFF